MVPAPPIAKHSSNLLVTLFSVASQHVPSIASLLPSSFHNGTSTSSFVKRSSGHDAKFIVFACLIPVLVLLSGLFAGLTLGYMSLDETQLNVLSISGTPEQRLYANRIKPIRKNGHLLLVTLLLANMITNETLPIIADPILGGGAQSVVVSTVLIVIFAEIIPQSLCTRHGLYFGSKMAGFTTVLIYGLGIVSWPVAKLLEFALGPHHGIIYRRAELKELIAMHSSMSTHGGDLKSDTVNIIGATLDLQEKVVKQAMTPIEHVFMLSINSKLDYELLKKICLTGHSRVPVYEEVEIPIDASGRIEKVKKIIGILLVKQCVLLDPKDAVPLSKIPLNKVPFVPHNEPLLGILDKFQEGRSHMAIVSRFSVDKAASIKKEVKRGLTQRLRDRVGMGESSDEDESDGKEKVKCSKDHSSDADQDNEGGGRETIDDGNDHESSVRFVRQDKKHSSTGRTRSQGRPRPNDLEMGIIEDKQQKMRASRPTALEQSMPADAVLPKKNAEEFLQSLDAAVMPLGIITLEDVLEELIGEEIYDEFDNQNPDNSISSYMPTEHYDHQALSNSMSAPDLSISFAETSPTAKELPKSSSTIPILRPIALKGMNFLRSRSAPPTPRDQSINLPSEASYFNPVSPTILEVDPLSSAVADFPIAALEASVAETDRSNIPSTILQGTGQATPSNVVVQSPITMAEGDEHRQETVKSKISTNGPGLQPLALPGFVTSHSSRSGSPAPSLEARLLERKRRLTGSPLVVPLTSSLATGTETRDGRPVGSRVVTPSVKGARFKSSPLGGGDRNGIVVAEKVKEEMISKFDGHITNAEDEFEHEGEKNDDQNKYFLS